MAKEIQQLTAMAVTRASKQGLYSDGAGLYLRVGRGGVKSWAFRFMLNGKAREMGLGGLAKVGLADARKKATDARLLLSDGRDPITHRQEEETRRAAMKLAAARSMTFESVLRLTSARTKQAGETKSTASSGGVRSPPTCHLSLAPFLSKTSTLISS